MYLPRLDSGRREHEAATLPVMILLLCIQMSIIRGECAGQSVLFASSQAQAGHTYFDFATKAEEAKLFYFEHL